MVIGLQGLGFTVQIYSVLIGLRPLECVLGLRV